MKITLGRGSNTTFPVKMAPGMAYPESMRLAWPSNPVSPLVLLTREYGRVGVTGIAPSARKMSAVTCEGQMPILAPL